MVAHADTQCPTRTALANDNTDYRCCQARHHCQVLRNRLAYAAFLGVDPRIGSRRIDQGHYGHAKAFGHLHKPQRLAITFRLWHPEVALHLVLHGAPLLLADNHYRLTFQASDASHDGVVITKMAIAM